MLRSFDYAAGAAIRENPGARVPATWVDDCAEAFLAGYGDITPGTIDRRSPLFVALWLDKALYEVIYELREQAGLVAHSGQCFAAAPRKTRAPARMPRRHRKVRK